jgi:predicted PurR-regulated permease PerM
MPAAPGVPRPAAPDDRSGAATATAAATGDPSTDEAPAPPDGRTRDDVNPSQDAPSGPAPTGDRASGQAATPAPTPAGGAPNAAPAPAAGPVPADDPAGLAAPAPVRTVDLDPRSVVVAMIAFAVIVAGTGVVRSATRTLTWCLIATLLALALNPLVGAVQRRLHVKRGVGVAAVLAALVLAVTLAAVVLGPPAVRQARDLDEEIPSVVEDLDSLPLIGETLRDNDVPARVQAFLEDFPERLAGDTSPIEGAARAVLGGLLAAVATLLVTVALLLDGDRLVRRARRLVPHRYRPRVERMGDLFYRIVGKYFAGSLLVASIAGTTVLVVALVLGLPLAPLIAVWVAVFDLVPQIGGAAGGIPFVLLGFTQGATTGVVCAVFFVLYLQFENNVLQPLVVGDAVDLSPPATMIAALIGVSAAGVPGALVSVPLLGAAKAVYLELRPGRRPPPRAEKGRPGRISRLIARLRRRRTTTDRRHPDAR